jgi:metallo-beta-lactamase family protein
MELQVCGAAREVTGSCYLVEVGQLRFLVDCGLHQGGREEEEANFKPFPFRPSEIDFLLLTHAHIDHAGRIPRLVKEGFRGPVYCTPSTADLADIMLRDSAHIQEMEAEWTTRKARRAGRGSQEPLYTETDARNAQRLFQPVEYDQVLEPGPGVRACFRDAGHILGSALVEVWLNESDVIAGGPEDRPPASDAATHPASDAAARPGEVKMVFSGDVGQPDQPIIRDPSFVTDTDYLVMECTYGDRLHEGAGDPEEELAAILKEAHATGGNVIIPSFAVGRTQELIYFLRKLCARDQLDMPIYVDSPLASEATDVFRRHREVFDEEANGVMAEGGTLFNFPELHYTQSADESRALNEKSGIIIISSSGMAEAGRIKHHLKHNLWRPEAHVVIVGFQAQGTLGRRIEDGEKMVRIFGEEIAVKAHIHRIEGLSAHADRDQLLAWASHFKPPRLTFLTHGEPQAAEAFKQLLERELHVRATIPQPNERFRLGGESA